MITTTMQAFWVLLVLAYVLLSINTGRSAFVYVARAAMYLDAVHHGTLRWFRIAGKLWVRSVRIEIAKLETASLWEER
jgi:hypothetical protein